MERYRQGHTTDNVQLDAPTSRAVAKGIGEKLQKALGTEQRFPDRLQQLLDRMRASEALDTVPAADR